MFHCSVGNNETLSLRYSSKIFFIFFFFWQGRGGRRSGLSISEPQFSIVRDIL